MGCKGDSLLKSRDLAIWLTVSVIKHVLTEQRFQPQHSINHPDYPAYHINCQYAEPTLSVPSQHLDLIKDVVSNQQMINYHVLTSPVYLRPYHQFDSMS